LLRHAGQVGAETTLDANLGINEQIREGKLKGLGGLERTRVAAGEEELGVAAGRRVGQDMLQRYTEFGVEALTQIDLVELRSRLQSGALSNADSQLLAALAEQDRSLYENIISGANVVAGVAGAYAGRG